jgi:hypothetical protein
MKILKCENCGLENCKGSNGYDCEHKLECD